MKTSLWNIRPRDCLYGLALAIALIAATQPAGAAEAAGVNYQFATQQGSNQLQLNGVGTRVLASSGLYTAGLYLEQPVHASQAVLANTGGKQLRLVMLRDAPSRQLAELLTQGLVDNASNDALSDLMSEIFDVGLLLSEHGVFRAGDTVQIDSHPATGTTITIGSGARAAPSSQSFANPGMFKVMMEIWLGEHPVDAGLKQALLGQSV
jgi:hypothetical protein